MKKNNILTMFIILLSFKMCLSSNYVYMQQLDADNFDRLVIDTKHVWLIYFYDSGIAHQSVLAELEKSAEALRGIFRVGAANIKEFSTQNYDVGKILYFGDQKNTPIIYTGSINYGQIVKFLLSNAKQLIEARSKTAKQLKSNQQYLQKQAQRANKQANQEAKLRQKSDTIVLNKESIRQTMLKSREPYVVNYYVANCSACIQLNREWQQVSSTLKGKVKVAKINVTQNQQLEDLLKITTFPVIRFYPGGVKNIQSIVQFGGIKKKTLIISWVNQNDKKQNQNNDLAELNSANYKQICKSSKSTCVIFFVQSKTDQTLMSLANLPNNYLKKPISFFYSIKDTQKEFAKQFGVVSYPNVLMTYCQRKTYWRLDHFDVKRIEDSIGQVMLGNRNNFIKYKFEEKLV